MTLTGTQEQFIKSWGALGSKWGINKTLAQIHALFLISEEELTAEDIMETLKVSRGNVNMNVRTLINWGLVYKENKFGERKEFFIGEKDMWLIFKRVLKVRKEQELDPMLEVLISLRKQQQKESENDLTAKRLKSIEKFVKEADRMLAKFIKMDENWFWSILTKLIK